MTRVPAKHVTKQVAKQLAFAAFDDYAKDAQRLAIFYRDIQRAAKGVYRCCPESQTDAAKHILESFEIFGCTLIARCEKMGEQFELDDAYDDKGNIAKAQVSKHISLLIGSFPNANPADPEVYTMMLIEEVTAATPTVIVLEAACRAIRRTAKFIPTISEVLSTIDEQDKLWNARWEAINCIEDDADRLRAKLTAELERRAVERIAFERQKAKAQPIAVGDRVRNPKLGPGTVTALVPIVGDGDHYRVRFDNSTERYVAGKAYLERLVEGEEGYAAPDLPMIENKPGVPLAPIVERQSVEVER